MKTIVWGLLALLLAAGIARLLSRKLLYYPAPMAPGREKTLAGLAPSVIPFSLDAGNKVTLQGWIIQKDMDRLPVLFYFGGNAEEVSLNIEAYLARVRANVVLVNYRGYGRSGGAPREADLKADALRLFDRIAGDYHLKPVNCAAWGRSLGSSIAAYLALNRNLGRLILTCPFDSIEAVAAGYYPGFLVRAALTDRHRTTDFSAGITCPTLVLAASDDEVIPAQRTKALYESLNCPKTLAVIPNSGHNTISEAEGYYDAVAGFLETSDHR